MIKQGGQSHLRSWDSTSRSNSTKQFKDLLVALLHWARRNLCRCGKATLNWSCAEAFPPAAHGTKIFCAESLPSQARGKPGVSMLCCPGPAGQSQNWFLQGQQRIWAGAAGYHFSGELVKGLTRTNQLQLPLLSPCLQQCLSFAKEYLKMNHGHLSSRLGQGSRPQQFVKRIISWVSCCFFFCQKAELTKLASFFCSYQWKRSISSTQK